MRVRWGVVEKRSSDMRVAVAWSATRRYTLTAPGQCKPTMSNTTPIITLVILAATSVAAHCWARPHGHHELGVAVAAPVEIQPNRPFSRPNERDELEHRVAARRCPVCTTVGCRRKSIRERRGRDFVAAAAGGTLRCDAIGGVARVHTERRRRRHHRE